jgi:hypothetical protein
MILALHQIKKYISSSLASGKKAVVGFDCEWDAFGVHKHKVATIQIAAADFCFVFHLPRLLTIKKQLPPQLIHILQDENLFKCGVRANGDVTRLNNQFINEIDPQHSLYIPPQTVIELKNLASQKGINLDRSGLRNMAETVLEKSLQKPSGIRVSKEWWSPRIGRGRLSKAQVDYAGSDVLVSKAIYDKLEASFISINQSIPLGEMKDGLRVNLASSTGRSSKLGIAKIVATAEITDCDDSARVWQGKKIMKSQVVVKVNKNDLKIPLYRCTSQSYNPQKSFLFKKINFIFI